MDGFGMSSPLAKSARNYLLMLRQEPPLSQCSRPSKALDTYYRALVAEFGSKAVRAEVERQR